ncbi:QcrA and Rieske domain-containing protein [Mycolicibacterium mengxianglii]|uniref:QcrA and Rieske domain-containing protein n=1 Tax=Mycolicibacterium mengxianglii TaxID=2736649 RepID=UPI0018D0231C|nr:Rieske (2Fe-2S) protein [Mycolicibacterium mengxianglii]
MTAPDSPGRDLHLSRPQFLCGLGVGVAAFTATACSTYSQDSAAETSAEPGSAPAALAGTADVPVGSGIIVEDIVLTQPASGEFKGFSTVCTHAGCRVNSVSDGTINCSCHGSKFNLDGTVATGPATKPLEAKTIRVEGESILPG